jgi:ferrous iron transport protein B
VRVSGIEESRVVSAPGLAKAIAEGAEVGVARLALLGNPNTGKTTLFNRLTGLRHKTSNFPGTTVEARLGRLTLRAGGAPGAETESTSAAEVFDLPGIYSLELDQLEAQICRDVLAGVLAPRGEEVGTPDAACVVVDATNLGRNLLLVGEVLRRRVPTVIAVNMIDLARKSGMVIDAAALARELGCAVVLVCARSGEGLNELRAALGRALVPTVTPPGSEQGLRAWAERVHGVSMRTIDEGAVRDRLSKTDAADRVLTHPVLGAAAFAAVMAGLFYAIFSLAKYPMDGITAAFDALGALLSGVMPAGILQDFLANGVLPGIGATVVFLPQICLLFFLISLLEDTGYLARAALLMDRLLRPFGLPGHSFVPLLSSHACALPGIMACRTIPDRRERLATILIAPFMSCSARIPVYVLLIGILFPKNAAMGSLAFIGCYALGMIAAVFTAVVVRTTVLKGRTRPLAIELPTYKWPSLRTALITTWDRALVFMKNAGTVILAIVIVLWWLGAYPKVPVPAAVGRMHRAAVEVRSGGDGMVAVPPGLGGEPAAPAGVRPAELAAEEREALAKRIDDLADETEARHAKAESFMGRIGRGVQPVFAPMGLDWQMTVGVMASFAAREVFATTMAVVVTGHEDTEEEGVLDRIATATRDDGVTPVFTVSTAWAVLVFYVLAMQCLATLVVTYRETGHVKWALLQLAWMSALAYGAATIVHQVLRAAGVA